MACFMCLLSCINLEPRPKMQFFIFTSNVEGHTLTDPLSHWQRHTHTLLERAQELSKQGKEVKWVCGEGKERQWAVV